MNLLLILVDLWKTRELWSCLESWSWEVELSAFCQGITIDRTPGKKGRNALIGYQTRVVDGKTAIRCWVDLPCVRRWNCGMGWDGMTLTLSIWHDGMGLVDWAIPLHFWVGFCRKVVGRYLDVEGLNMGRGGILISLFVIVVDGNALIFEWLKEGSMSPMAVG